MDEAAAIAAFLNGSPFAVAGASNDRSKYGNRVLRCYWSRGRVAYPINPNAPLVEGKPAFPSVSALPEPIHGLSLVTPPEVSRAVVADALKAGVRHFWFQPGSEHPAAMASARDAGAVVIADGPCILVVLGYRGE